MNIKFTEDELTSIRTIQQRYNTLGIQLIQLEVSRKEIEDRLSLIREQEAILREQIHSTNKEERELAKTLDTKYGVGSLDLDTGEFTPKPNPK